MTEPISVDVPGKPAFPRSVPAPLPVPVPPPAPASRVDSPPKAEATKSATGVTPAPKPSAPPFPITPAPTSAPGGLLARWGKKQLVIGASAVFSLAAGIGAVRLMFPAKAEPKPETPAVSWALETARGTPPAPAAKSGEPVPPASEGGLPLIPVAPAGGPPPAVKVTGITPAPGHHYPPPTVVPDAPKYPPAPTYGDAPKYPPPTYGDAPKYPPPAFEPPAAPGVMPIGATDPPKAPVAPPGSAPALPALPALPGGPGGAVSPPVTPVSPPVMPPVTPPVMPPVTPVTPPAPGGMVTPFVPPAPDFGPALPALPGAPKGPEKPPEPVFTPIPSPAPGGAVSPPVTPVMPPAPAGMGGLPPIPVGPPTVVPDTRPPGTLPPIDVNPKPAPTFTPPTGMGTPAAFTKPGGTTEVRPLLPEVAPKTDFDVDLYDPKDGDSYETISQEYYNDRRYGAALRAFNQSQPLQGGRFVNVPPMHILRKRFPAQVGGVTPVGGAGGVPAASPQWGPAGGNPDSGAARAPAVGRAGYVIPPGGMTMKAVARLTLGNEQRWRDIYDLNSNLRPDDLLPAGTELKLPADARVP